MRLWVDDERQLADWRNKPGFEYLLDGEWVQAFSYSDAVLKISHALRHGLPIEAVSLDNDLGDQLGREGYDVLCIIEKSVITGAIPLPLIFIHTANASAGTKMRLVVARLQERYG